MREAALKRGIDIQSKARQISSNDFEYFDLILTMDNANLIDVQSLSKNINYSFSAKIKPLLEYAINLDLQEVPDPYYGGDKGFDRVLDILELAIDGLINAIKVT